MFDIRDHGGVFGTGKYRKGAFINIMNLSYPTKLPVKSLFTHESGSLSAMYIEGNYLFIQTLYGSYVYFYKYLLAKDDNGSIVSTLVTSGPRITSSKGTSIMFFPPNKSYFIVQTEAGYSKVDKISLSIISTKSYTSTETVIDAFMVTDDTFMLVLTSANNGSKFFAVFDFNFTQLNTTFTAFTTYSPVRFDGGYMLYKDNSSKFQLYDPTTNNITEQASGILGSNGNYGKNRGNLGVTIGNRLFIPYQNIIYVLSLENDIVTLITSLQPFGNGTISGFMKYDDTILYAHTADGTIALINTESYEITLMPKKLEIYPSSVVTGGFIEYEIDSENKTFLYNTNDNSNYNMVCPIFKTKILNN